MFQQNNVIELLKLKQTSFKSFFQICEKTKQKHKISYEIIQLTAMNSNSNCIYVPLDWKANENIKNLSVLTFCFCKSRLIVMSDLLIHSRLQRSWT